MTATAPTAESRADESRSTAPHWILVVAVGFVIGSTVTWRVSTYYSGGVDPVVAAKALMNVAALGLAFAASRRRAPRYRMNSLTWWFLAAVILIGLFGAKYTATTFSSSLVLSLRVLVVALTVHGLLRFYDVVSVLRVLCAWIVAIVAVAVVTGAGTSTVAHLAGRLQGGTPPLAPNEITELLGIVIVGVVWRQVQHRGRGREFAFVVGLLGICWLTGSRTGLVAIVAAIVVLLFWARRLPPSAVIVLIATVPVLAYFVFGTSKVSGFFDRGGSSNITTLSDRTVAWSAAFHLHHGFWDTWFGSGLSMVQIPVSAQYRTVQLLDSSWVSALVQSGILGFAALILWMVFAAGRAFAAPPAYRSLMVALFVSVLFRTFLESGLIGSTPMYVLLLIISFRPVAIGFRQPDPGALLTAGPPAVAPKSREMVTDRA